MKNIQEQLKRGNKVGMHPDEKGLIRATLLRKITNSPVAKNATSPYIKNILVTMRAHVASPFQFHAFAKVTAIALIILLGGGTTLSFASEKALPGEALYSFKVSVREPVKEALALTKEDRAEIQAKRIVTRVEEVKALKEEGTLTEEKSAMVKELIEEQSASFIETATDLNNEEGTNESLVETTAVLLTSLNEYSDAVEEELVPAIEEPALAQTDTDTTVSTMMAVEGGEEKILDEEPLKKSADLEVPSELTDISAVISAVTKSIETELPTVVEAVKEQEVIEDQKEEALKQEEVEIKSTNSENISACKVDEIFITEEQRLKAEKLVVKNKIDTTNLVLTGVSEKDGLVALQYKNIISGITIYENSITYTFVDEVLKEKIGEVVNKKPFDETTLKINAEKATELGKEFFTNTSCVKATLVAYRGTNVVWRMTWAPLWHLSDGTNSVLISAETGERIKIEGEEYLRK